MAPFLDSKDIYDQVGKHYGAAARVVDEDGSYAQRVASAFGYSEADLQGMPADANLGLSCGNPIALAGLREGETVCDLGSGAGFDVFQAAKKVGEKGMAIGVDFNTDMLQRAESIKAKTAAANTRFVESSITKVNLPDSSVDCVISNCVVNLVPEAEKQLVFNEMFRLLKPGGRVAVSDILAKGELPEQVKNDMALYVGCIAGASQVAAYEDYLRKAGFNDILLIDAKSDLNVYWQGGGPCCGPSEATAPVAEETKSSCCSSSKASGEEKKAEGKPQMDFNDFAGSYKIFAVKP